jgi:hypothetical protein
MKQFFIAIFSLVWMGNVFSQNSNQELSQMKELLQEISINAIELGYINAKLSPKQLEAKCLGFEREATKCCADFKFTGYESCSSRDLHC